MELFVAFRLLAESHAVSSVPSGQKRHFPVLNYARKKHQLIQMYVCNAVIVAKIENKFVWPE